MNCQTPEKLARRLSGVDLLRRLTCVFTLGLLLTSVARANAVLSIGPETINPDNVSGFFIVQIASTGVDLMGDPVTEEAVGSFNLQVDFTDFTDDMAGDQVTISVDDLLWPASTSPPDGTMISEGGSFAYSGFVIPPNNKITVTPMDFIRVNFTVTDPLTGGSFFANTSLDQPGQVIGIAAGFDDIYQRPNGSTGQRIGTAVPEPGTMAICGVMAAGVVTRQLRRRKKK